MSYIFYLKAISKVCTALEFQLHLWSPFTNTQRPQVHVVGQSIRSVSCADGHRTGKASDKSLKNYCTWKIWWLVNWITNCLLFALPRYTDKTVPLHPFLLSYARRLRRFSGGYRADKIFLLIWAARPVSFVILCCRLGLRTSATKEYKCSFLSSDQLPNSLWKEMLSIRS
jgi:hypothetical protein